MRTKTVKKTGEGEDILGLVAFGSLISNIFQLASKKSLGEQHEALKAYTTELKRHYGNMMLRERQVYSRCLELKRANEELLSMNNQLLKELMAAQEKINRLESGKTEPISKRRRYVPGVGATK
jgi:predicted RNase H-like nuclease (RuvC/YqgF family)